MDIFFNNQKQKVCVWSYKSSIVCKYYIMKEMCAFYYIINIVFFFKGRVSTLEVHHKIKNDCQNNVSCIQCIVFYKLGSY